jgi:hypothetical protein
VFLQREGGGKTAAILMSLLMTAQAAEIRLGDYFRDVLVRLSTCTDVTKLTPYGWREHYAVEVNSPATPCSSSSPASVDPARHDGCGPTVTTSRPHVQGADLGHAARSPGPGSRGLSDEADCDHPDRLVRPDWQERALVDSLASGSNFSAAGLLLQDAPAAQCSFQPRECSPVFIDGSCAFSQHPLHLWPDLGDQCLTFVRQVPPVGKGRRKL